MDEKTASASRRRLGAQGMVLRRQRVFARLRDGLSYEEIAAEEGVTIRRVRQIVAEVLRKRTVDSGADHAKLQLERLAPAMQLAAEAMSAGDVSAIAPYSRCSTGSTATRRSPSPTRPTTMRRARSFSTSSTA